MNSSHSPEKWKIAEKLASKLEVEYGSDVSRLLSMEFGELEDRLETLEGHGFSTVNRRKKAGKGLKTVEYEEPYKWNTDMP